MLSSSSKSSSKSSSSSSSSSECIRVVASADRVPLRSDEPQVSGTATACKREMLSTIGSEFVCHGSTTDSSLVMLLLVVVEVFSV